MLNKLKNEFGEEDCQRIGLSNGSNMLIMRLLYIIKILQISLKRCLKISIMIQLIYLSNKQYFKYVPMSKNSWNQLFKQILLREYIILQLQKNFYPILYYFMEAGKSKDKKVAVNLLNLMLSSLNQLELIELLEANSLNLINSLCKLMKMLILDTLIILTIKRTF
ncbi:unnamed protein product [Paramecium sonneborni]|uniref:Uncharacterized protein n=1 Tax=Paramecium sonneborni TaxID=65129 RepID=A0A8S1QY27_9CILI|nr:unnamed protein product [Paramecium sonneborni]